jgi:hypothetical protein
MNQTTHANLSNNNQDKKSTVKIKALKVSPKTQHNNKDIKK